MKKKAISLVVMLAMLVMLVPSGWSGMKVSAAAHNVDEAMAWCESKIGKAVGSSTQCVAFVQAYYSYLGVTPSTGHAYEFSSNPLPSGWSRVKGGVPQRGDILVYTGAKYGHVGIYAGNNTVYHQNFGYPYVIKSTNWNYDKSWYSDNEGGTKSYWGYIRPDFTVVPPDPIPPDPVPPVTDHNPKLCLDKVIVNGKSITVIGWAYDPDKMSANIPVQVYIDNGLGGEAGLGWTTANKGRPDVDAVEHCGSMHGFEAAFDTPSTGTYNVHVYAINYGEGSNTKISRQVTVGGADIRGNYEGAAVNGNKITVSGWAYDKADIQKNTGIHIYADGPNGGQQYIGGGAASNSRQDVMKVENCGEFHGFSITCDAPRTGTYNVYVYAISVDGTNSKLLGAKQVTVLPDTEKPVISEAKTTVIPGVGYTVTCKITDNYGVTKVQFPTWSEKNGQDDMVKNWTDSSDCAGQKNGNVYTYNVKITDHKNDLGTYHTHIYAWDGAGNITVLAVAAVLKNDYTVKATIVDNGHIYSLYDDFTSWSEARDKCASLGGYLATITSSHEQDVINKLVQNGNRTGYWLGGTDTAQEGSFKWITGEAFSYTNWKSGQPDNAGDEDYIHLYRNNNGAVWNDNTDSGSGVDIGFICEKEATYAVTYNANGGTDAPAAQTKTHGTNLTLSNSRPTRSGYMFLGWSADPNAATAEYAPGAAFTKDETTTLYAVWQRITLSSVTIQSKPNKLTYRVGDTLDTTGLVLTANYNDGTTQEIKDGFTCTPTALTAAGMRIVTVSYGGKTTSFTVNVTAANPLKITAQPKTAVVLKGGTVKFTVGASGDDLAYQWQISDDGGNTWRNSAVKTATYTTTLTASNNGRRMRCIVADKYDNFAISNAAVMWMSGLKITAQPKTAVVLNGGTVKFTVGASGDGLTYQWQISDDGGKTWRNSAVKIATYTTTLSSKINGRRMRCVVSDKYGNKVTSNAAAMWMSALKITQQPSTAQAKNNGTVQFTVKANGDSLTYQWQISDDGGKTWRNSAVKTATYTTTLTMANNGRRMRCVVSDKYGNKVTSNAAAMWMTK